MFIKLSMVRAPIMAMIYFAIWWAGFCISEHLEDRCYFKAAKNVRIGRLFIILIVAIIVSLIEMDEYMWVHSAIIMIAMSFMVLTFLILVVMGWDIFISPLIRKRTVTHSLDIASILLYGIGMIVVSAYLLASMSAIFHWDWFFDLFCSKDQLVEYHLALSEFQDEHSGWNWEEYELCGD